MKPLIALHKDTNGNILNAGAFDYSHNLESWMRSLDIQAGDIITFGEKAARTNPVDPLAILAPADKAA